MSAFAAILLDSYRELNSKKLFWITLAISAIVVLTFGSISFNETGISLFFGLSKTESQFLKEGSPLSVVFYRGLFSYFIVTIWLAWAATIMALVSTASIFPEFASSGTIDLSLSKPIRRVPLYVMKYIASLLFVAFQVGLFCVGIFLCFGLRLGDWDPRIFLAIPLVVAFYSYLFCFCALLGVLTRSALASLLLTILFWFCLFGVAQSKEILDMIIANRQVDQEQYAPQHEELRAEITYAEKEGNEEQVSAFRLELRDEAHAALMEEDDAYPKLVVWSDRVDLLLAPLPKTGQTIDILRRVLERDTDISFADFLNGNVRMNQEGEPVVRSRSDDEEVQMRLIEQAESKSYFYIIGTSLLFEVAILSFGAFVFYRRDF